MPDRMLREKVVTSPNIELLSDGAEVLFYRLSVKADDYGRHDARLAVIKSACFPIRKRMTETKLARQLVELMEAVDPMDPEEKPLVIVYEVSGRPYLQMATWANHQRVRASQSKFPPSSDGKLLTSADICPQVPADGGRGHPLSNVRNSRTNAGSLRKRSTGSKTKSGSEVKSVSTDPPGEAVLNGGVQAHEPKPQEPERLGLSAEAQALKAQAEASARKAATR